MGFTKFCAALLNHPDVELQAIPQTMLEQVPHSFCPTFPPMPCPGDPQGHVPLFPHPGASTHLAAEMPWCRVSAADPLTCRAVAGSSQQVSNRILGGFCSSGLRSTKRTPEQLHHTPCCRLPHALPLHRQRGGPGAGTAAADPLRPDAAGLGHHGPAAGLGPDPRPPAGECGGH